MPPKAAVTASLLIIGVTSTAALIAQRGSRLVSIRTGIAFGAAGMVGAFAGARLAAWVPDALLQLAFGLLLTFTSIGMLRREPLSQDQEGRSQPASPQRSLQAVRMLTLGLSIGIVTGMLGAGGGFLIVPALAWRGQMSMQRAVATSLLAIALQSFAGFVGHLGHASLDWAVVVPFTLVATLGSVLGSLAATRAPQRLFRRGFAIVVLLVALVVVARALPAVAALSTS
jgi:uncharacterized membrane protein YfcA